MPNFFEFFENFILLVVVCKFCSMTKNQVLKRNQTYAIERRVRRNFSRGAGFSKNFESFADFFF